MKNYRWYIIVLAFLAIIITYLDRMALSYAIGPLKATFGLTNADFGLIASGFGIVGISLGLGFGMMPNAVFYAINTDLAKDRAGTSLGIMDCAFAAAGILAPYITGILSDITGNFNMAIYLMVGLMIVAALGIIIFQHPDKARKLN
jgi:sugar phosphate permease